VVHITQECESGSLRGNSVGVTLMAKYERKRATMKDHDLTAEKLKTGWLFPLNTDHQYKEYRLPQVSPPPPPGELDLDQIIWRDRTTAGPKLSELPRDPDYQGLD
jgi:hypothetical protein